MTPASLRSETEGTSATTHRRAAYCFALAAGVLALVFAFIAMQGARDTSPVYADASRHALNGALLLDMVRDGGWRDPARFAREYYVHLPAISIPYHPPMFPLVESGFYALLGVSTWSARLAVAACVFVSFLLLVAIARGAGLRAVSSLAAACAFAVTPTAQVCSGDVMLEFPSLVFVAASVWFMQKAMAGGAPLRLLVWAAVFAAAALWTKQGTVFLIGIPAFVLLIRRQWTGFRDWRLWVFHAVVLAAFAGVLASAQLAGAAGNTGWKHWPLWQRVLHHAEIYGVGAWQVLGAVPAIACVVGLVTFAGIRFRGQGRGLDVVAAWFAGSLGLLLVLPPWDVRYLFYTLPPAAMLVFFAVDRFLAGLGLSTRGHAAVIAVLVAALFASAQWAPRRSYGYAEAARLVAAESPKRILLLSMHNNGAFTFEYRARQTDWSKTHILRGHGLDAAQVEPQAFLKLLHEYGIDWVVVEDNRANHPYEGMLSIRDARLEPRGSIPAGTPDLGAGSLHVYRHTQPSAEPKGLLIAPSTIVRKGQQLRW